MTKKNIFYAVIFIFCFSLATTPRAYAIGGGPPPSQIPVIKYRTTTSITTAVGNPPAGGDFTALMTGQGRNTAAMGQTQADFIQNAHARGDKFLTKVGNYDTYLQQIYQASLQHNVNPAIVLTIWGVESSFTLNGDEFGNGSCGTGFATQLNCTVTRLSGWMDFFKQNSTNGSYTIPQTNCTYTDQFIFAYEKYTPVCAITDGNDPNRTNFKTFYKTFTNQPL